MGQGISHQWKDNSGTFIICRKGNKATKKTYWKKQDCIAWITSRFNKFIVLFLYVVCMYVCTYVCM